ncbi:WxcM-like domain-containing protein [Flavisolibacter nicotianae]|uniref:WxcM-like domain-containing protein n=1 Tax=Flavisolibacter nicotianae TaxID=2364882 RepID=UPI000EB34A4B
MLDQVRRIQLPGILDERGNLSFFENETQLSFSLARTFWKYVVPGGVEVGAFAIVGAGTVVTKKVLSQASELETRPALSDDSTKKGINCRRREITSSLTPVERSIAYTITS